MEPLTVHGGTKYCGVRKGRQLTRGLFIHGGSTGERSLPSRLLRRPLVLGMGCGLWRCGEENQGRQEARGPRCFQAWVKPSPGISTCTHHGIHWVLNLCTQQIGIKQDILSTALSTWTKQWTKQATRLPLSSLQSHWQQTSSATHQWAM